MINIEENYMEGQYLSGGYYKVTLDGKVHGVHRLVWEAANGPVPAGFVVDHIDRNPLNNELSNLRAIPKGANKANTKSSRELPKGVYSRFNKTKGCLVYWGKLSMRGVVERFPTTEDLESVSKWAEETHARILKEVYGVVNIN